MQIVLQILEERARGKKVGFSVIEPKGDIVATIKEICDEIGEPFTYINPDDTANSDTINVMAGDKSAVAEATVAVLKSLFGKQEAFFATVQELSARKVTLLLKEIYGDNMYITDVVENLRDETIMRQNVEILRQKGTDPDLVSFFDHELLHGKDAEEYRKLIKGLRAQLENITSNEYLKPIITRKSSFNLDKHFEEGGILACNTALGTLGRAASDAFGQFIAMHLQLATFRRKGTERTRIPHYLIIDEYSRYINPDVETFLSIAAEYRVAGIFATQSLGQLEVEAGKLSPKATKTAILTSCRNKIIFGGLSAQDAKEISEELGKDIVIERSQTFEGSPLKGIGAKTYKDAEAEKVRFPYTFLMDGLPRFHFVYKLLKDGHPQPPGVGVGRFIPRDKDKIREHFRKIKEGIEPEGEQTEDASLLGTLKKRIYEKAQKKIEQKNKERFQKAFEVNPFSELDQKENEPKISSPVFKRREEVKGITFISRENKDEKRREMTDQVQQEIKETQTTQMENNEERKQSISLEEIEETIEIQKEEVNNNNNDENEQIKHTTEKNEQKNKSSKEKQIINPLDFWDGF